MAMNSMRLAVVIGLLTIFSSALCQAQQASAGGAATQGDFTIRNFHFHGGEVIPQLQIHYVTWGTPNRNETGEIVNAALLLHGTGGAGINFGGTDGTADASNHMIGPGGALDSTIYFVIAPDAIGSGKSSKPSDGLREKFPRYNLEDVAAAEKALVESLGVHHLALVAGVSLGGRRTWQWGVQFPDFMDALVPMISSPKPNAGRRAMIDLLPEAIIRNDPGFEDGNYKTNPKSVQLAERVYGLWLTGAGGLQQEYPTRESAEKSIGRIEASANPDANDFIYQVRMNDEFDAWSQLDRIRVPVLMINMAGDLMVPRELGDAKAAAGRLKNATYLEVTEGFEYGHGGLFRTIAVWGPQMREWLSKNAAPRFGN
jgi:homoserine O-acetyltransferase